MRDTVLIFSCLVLCVLLGFFIRYCMDSRSAVLSKSQAWLAKHYPRLSFVSNVEDLILHEPANILYTGRSNRANYMVLGALHKKPIEYINNVTVYIRHKNTSGKVNKGYCFKGDMCSLYDNVLNFEAVSLQYAKGMSDIKKYKYMYMYELQNLRFYSKMELTTYDLNWLDFRLEKYLNVLKDYVDISKVSYIIKNCKVEFYLPRKFLYVGDNSKNTIEKQLELINKLTSL